MFFGGALVLTLVLSPFLIVFLKRLGITRKDEYDFSTIIAQREEKVGTPVMGGLIIVLVVSGITVLFNWHREATFVPIGVFLLSAMLGGADDLLNIFYRRVRPARTLSKELTLTRVHKNIGVRIWHAITFPWNVYKRFFYLLGSHPGSGIQPHEKILVQFLIGAIVAWWMSSKLNWTQLWIPWHGEINLGWGIVPVIIFLVMFMANAVNITDGIDGLSAGTLLFAYGAYFVIALQQGSVPIVFLIATIMGSLLGYLFFNITPARYQMGDVASLGLGVMLTAIAFVLNRAILLPFIGGIFVIEIFSVLIQTMWRVVFGHRIFAMSPLHHHLEMQGWSEARIVMYAWALATLFFVGGIWLSMH